MTSLAPQDATRYWLSRRAVNDLFLLYCFDDAGASFESLREEVLARAAGIPDLGVRLREYRFAYPRWVSCDAVASQITEPVVAGSVWTDVVAALENLLSCGVRAEEYPWRLHLFRGVRGAPGGDAPALVAVLQLSHALADGRRAADIARALWSDVPVSEPNSSERVSACRGRLARAVVRGPLLVETAALLKFPIAMARTVIRGLAAERARRELADLTTRGKIPTPATDFPPTRLNHPPAPTSHAIRMLVRDDLRVPGHTVTVVAATAIAVALSRYLSEHGEPNIRLGAQISMAVPAPPSSSSPRNNYADLAIELPVREPNPHIRAARISTALTARRTRTLHP
ncbi:WS/DGAT/MGAT family O-acyltransferase [Nocardia macrotermitis]|uniref:Diacylglycerol O-acyltransferase n=1 Tax=Nocardia macrotermitis TaxID=2585198 RepID=A0A7K0CWJ7_9NOCA|nr:hypothetical protein [Nocardia macrotermitis]MQY17798.1 hypothetical protein [Nocardia macrotermitis]